MERLRIEPATLRVSDWVFSEPPTITITRCASTHTPCAFSLSLSLSPLRLSLLLSLLPPYLRPFHSNLQVQGGWEKKISRPSLERDCRPSAPAQSAGSRCVFEARRIATAHPRLHSRSVSRWLPLNKHRSLEMKRLRNQIGRMEFNK